MRKIGILAALCLLGFDAQAGTIGLAHGGPVPPACTATPSAAATAAGLTRLVQCDTFATNQHIDINNTQQPGYVAYVQSADLSIARQPPSFYSNDGSGTVNINGSSTVGSGGYPMLSVGASPNPPYYVGHVYTGSFYAQVNMKFNPIQPFVQNSHHPTFWFGSAEYSLNGVIQPSVSPFVEGDVLECNEAGQNNPCTLNQQMHVWTYNGSGFTQTCSYAGGYSASTPDFNSYHTIGILFLTRADNGGTGELVFTTDGVTTLTITYTASSVTSSFGSGGTGPSCHGSDMLALETMLNTFIFSSGNQWGVAWQNWAVFQK